MMIDQPRIIQFVYKAPVFLIGLMGFLYAIYMMVNFRENTIAITNTGFVVLATLAALSFSFARVVESDELKDRILFAGERFLHGAILILIASILKYFIFLVLKNPIFSSSVKLELGLSFTIGVLAGIIFSNGVLFAHTGLRVLNDLLLMRFTRHSDWDDLW
jgi:hypothetical protein